MRLSEDIRTSERRRGGRRRGIFRELMKEEGNAKIDACRRPRGRNTNTSQRSRTLNSGRRDDVTSKP